MMDSNDKIWIMMGRSLSGEISADEQKELHSLLKLDLHLNHRYSLLKKLWNKSFTQDDVLEEENNEETLFKKIICKAEIDRQNANKISQRNLQPFIQRLFSKRLIYTCAASVALAVVLFIGKSKREVNTAEEQVISAQNGSRSKVLLSDGTTVWLNGGSKLYYDYEFSGTQREVRLDGEAFFDVVKQKDRPFIVHAGKIDIIVHGTVFNVKYYQGDKNIEATLLHGQIEVTDNTNKAKPSVFLVPNQKLIIPQKEPSKTEKSAPDKTYELVNLDAKLQETERIETAWIYNRVEFRGETFEELAGKLERWYNVKIEFEDDNVKALTFNGSFEKETAEQAFNALQKVGAFNFNIQGREIFIRSLE
jgi:ferric-dicitrate binding protein FerR (iron transport regulator)